MERHKCKLCSRTFANGRALGGHMKAHLATLPLPPKPPSPSFSSSESDSETETGEKPLTYVLRENPKRSFRLADPEFSFQPDTAASVLVQDRESETDSKNPIRTRSKRTRTRRSAAVIDSHSKKPKLSFMESPPTAEQAEPVSSVSDTSPEEDVAMCLMMLSRDRWSRSISSCSAAVTVADRDQKPKPKGLIVGEEEIKVKKVRGRHRCENCGKTFRSSGALGSHTSICICDDEEGNDRNGKIFPCPFCSKVFGSGQALGGHKRSHLLMPPSSSTANAAVNRSVTNSFRSLNLKECFIDLNLPAPTEDDDLSVVSDA